MKKLVSLMIAAAFVLTPVAAVHAKKEKMTKEEAEAAEIAKQHDNSWRLVRDSAPLLLPSWSLPIFFGTHMDEKLKKM